MIQIPLQLGILSPKTASTASSTADLFPEGITQVDDRPTRADSTDIKEEFTSAALSEKSKKINKKMLKEGLSLEKSSPGGYVYIDYNLNDLALQKKLTGEAQTHDIDSLIAGQEKVFNLSEMAANGESVTLSRKDVRALNKAGIGLNYTWYADDPHQADQDIIVDNLKGFIAVDGKKVLTWRASGRSGPKIYGMPTVEGELRTDYHVPLSRHAVKADGINNMDFRNAEGLTEYLRGHHAIPPAGQRVWDLENFPKPANDLRDISNFTRQQESRKLLLNMMRFQPELPDGHEYNLDNNLRLIKISKLESNPPLQIGPDPHIYSFYKSEGEKSYLKRRKTVDGLDTLTYKTGSHGGMAQFKVNKPMKTAIAGTPFVNKETGEWTGYKVNGKAINSAEDFLNSPLAQNYALFYTQEKYSRIKRTRGSERDPAGIAGVSHLLGSPVAREGDYYSKKDGNGTKGIKYYDALKGYPYQSFPKSLRLKKDSLLDNGINPELVKITAEGQAKLDEEYRLAYEKTHPVKTPQNEKNTNDVSEEGANQTAAEAEEMLNTPIPESNNNPPVAPPVPATPAIVKRRARNKTEEVAEPPYSEEDYYAGGGNPSDKVLEELPLPNIEVIEPSIVEEPQPFEPTEQEILEPEEVLEEVIPVELVNEVKKEPIALPETIAANITVDVIATPTEDTAEPSIANADKPNSSVSDEKKASELPNKSKNEEVVRPKESKSNKSSTKAKKHKKADAERAVQESKMSFSSSAVALGSLLSIPVAVKSFFLGQKDPETQKREKPSMLKLLAGATLVGLAGVAFHQSGATSWIANELKRRSGGSQGLDR